MAGPRDGSTVLSYDTLMLSFAYEYDYYSTKLQSVTFAYDYKIMDNPCTFLV